MTATPAFIQVPEKVIYINYVDQIEQERTKYLMAVIINILQKEMPSVLYFSIASSGGSVDAGIALYNFLKALPIRVIMHNIGSIDSIATVVFAAGEERYASPHSTFLFHGVKFDFNGPISINRSQLEEMSSIIEHSHKKIASIVCENSKLKMKEIEKLFHTGKAIDSDFALKREFIHEIKPLKIPEDASIISINFSGQA